MPKEILGQANPGALKSQLPDFINELSVKLETNELPEETHLGLREYQNAACYIAAGKLSSSNKPSTKLT
jgi:xylulose-5-phosphate/fructose-6-phosphate phosphoketolase